MTESNYKILSYRNWLKIERRACRGTAALVAYDSIPDRFKKIIKEKYGDPYEKTKHTQFKDHIKNDTEAMAFYSTYKLADGRNLPSENIQEYVSNAMILNALNSVAGNRAAQRRALGGSTTGMWEKLAQIIDQLRDEYNHTLPANPRRLKEKMKSYLKEGYTNLIHRNFCNDNSRKVSASIENLILSIYRMPNKPFSASVHDVYLQFLGGSISVVDQDTGELFDRNDFFDSNQPVFISESTIWNYINNPKNRVSVDKARNDSKYFNDTHRPHHHRISPMFSLSKISMDDRDIPNSDVKAYYAYDVASGCIIGKAYSKDKTTQLFIDCMRDMFRFIDRYNLGMPMEVEVEHHLVNQFADDLMKAGIVFPFVRWCNAGNSQEKWAETGNRLKKYGFEKRYQEGIGRFYSRTEANRPPQIGEWDEKGMRIKDRKRDFDKSVADDIFTIEKYNNSLHPKQKTYPGKTRLEVLLMIINPELAKIDRALLTRYIGDKTTTSIRRSQYVTVQYEKYQLPHPRVLRMLKPNNYVVDAFYLPTDTGIDKVYLYQGGEFICECKKLEAYNTATCEQTETDREAYTEQAKYVAQFDKMSKNGKDNLKKLIILENNTTGDDEPVEVVKIEVKPKSSWDQENDNDFDYGNKAVNDF